MSEWQPIDTAPKDGTEILVYGRHPYDGEYITTAEYQSRHSMFMHGYSTTVGHSRLTHWMPLPEPPVRQEKDLK